jgi:hypothetical protein
MVLLPGAKFLPELREPLYRGDRRNKNEWNAQGRACNTLVCPQACKGLDDGSLVSEPALTRPIYHVEVARPRPVFFCLIRHTVGIGFRNRFFTAWGRFLCLVSTHVLTKQSKSWR